MTERKVRRKSRREALAEIRTRFVAKGSPRLVIFTFVSLAGLAAFGMSTALFRAGIDGMGTRYVAATVVGYAVFLFLIRLWIEFNRRPDARDSDDYLPRDIPSTSDASGGDSAADFSGGSSGGGGASGSWEGGGLPTLDVDLPDADEAWPLIVVIAIAAVVLLGGIVALFYVVYYAPLLLAEVALDAALVTGIYRKLRKQDTRNWLGSAVRHTWKPAAIIAACLFVAGTVIQWLAPSARTIGDILR
jgi:uncharacterized membrane protein YgcG